MRDIAGKMVETAEIAFGIAEPMPEATEMAPETAEMACVRLTKISIIKLIS